MGKKLPSMVVDQLLACGWNPLQSDKKDDAWVRDGVSLVISPSHTTQFMFGVEWSRLGSVKVRFLDQQGLFRVIDSGSF